ncbi:MAG: hypothetical protein QM655_05590 [Nocardioidaceae bacterium]
MAILVFARTYQVHAHTWDWRLMPAAAPTKLEFDGRDYQRSDSSDGTSVEPAYVARGTTSGGGKIWGPRTDGTPTILYVRDGDRTWGYELMGGP